MPIEVVSPLSMLVLGRTGLDHLLDSADAAFPSHHDSQVEEKLRANIAWEGTRMLMLSK